MGKAYDWAAVKARYVTGHMSLRELSLDGDMPTLRQIHRRSAKENWPTAREEYQRRVVNKTTEAAALDAAQVIAEQLSTGTWLHKTSRMLLQGMVQNAVATLMGPGGKLDPSKLEPDAMVKAGISPSRLMRMLELGVEVEGAVLKGEEQINVRVESGLERVLEVIQRHADPDTFAAILKDLESAE